MDQRRFLVFIFTSMLLWIVWIQFFAPALGLIPKVDPAAELRKRNATLAASEEPVDALFPDNAAIAANNAELSAIESHPEVDVWLGPKSTDQDQSKLDEFFLAVNLKSNGAAVSAIELTDIKRYPAIGDREKRVQVVDTAIFREDLPKDGKVEGKLNQRWSNTRLMEMRIPAIDAILKDVKSDQVNWELVDHDEKNADSAVFRLRSPDGRFEITKEYRLKRLTPAEAKTPGIRDQFAGGYQLTLAITVKNLSAKKQDISYTLRGPVGMPLEDRENTYKYRDVRLGLLGSDGKSVEESKVSASEIVKRIKDKKVEISKRPVQYVGVDVQYFAALIQPLGDQIKSPSIERVEAVVVSEDKASTQYSDISFDMVSPNFELPAGGELKHEYLLYAGPKRKELVQQVSAGAVMDYGWFDSLCRGMVFLLNAFHSLGLNYGIAILCLTALVRTLLIPLSKHQAMHAAKMKELQPKIQARQKELEAKHGKNTEEYMKASQELVAEQSKMMLGGCLPVFLQLPIFIALYRAISSSIELRMEPFLWFENLAAPDALFPLPFRVPFLGWTEFNLLPCISAALMYVQQKLTMPPPANQEQADQQKIMNFMMIIMIGAFYRVPSGLCLYFIATNIWSMTERWIMERKAKRAKLIASVTAPKDEAVLKTAAQPSDEPKKPSQIADWWRQMQQAADTSRTIRNEPRDNDKGGKKKRDR